MKTSFKILASFIFLVSGFLFLSQNTFASIYTPDDLDWNPDPTTYSFCTPNTKLECDNAYSNSDNNACGTSCVGLCGDSGFNQGDSNGCLINMNSTAPWTKYSALSYTCTYVSCSNPYSLSCETTAFRHYFASSVCSTADKVDSNSDTNLDFGYCSCSVGNRYKSCCQSNPDGSFSGSAVYPHNDDNQDPLEADCPATSVYSLSCPQPSTITITDKTQKGPYKPGDTVQIHWEVTNPVSYTLPGDSELSSVSGPTCTSSDIQTNDQGSGTASFVIPSNIPIDTKEIPVTVTCNNYYGVPIPGGKSQVQTAPRSNNIKLALQGATCLNSSDANKSFCAQTPKPDQKFTYNSTINVDRLSDPQLSCPVPKDSCYVSKCARCTDLPGKNGTWVEWYDRNNDNCSSDWDNQRVEKPNDERCTATCNISLTPVIQTLSGASATLTAQSADNSVQNCTIDNGVGSVTPPEAKSVSPKNTTTYTISCSAKKNPDNKCSAEATVTVSSKCDVSITPSSQTINLGDKASLTLQTTDVQSCDVSGTDGSTYSVNPSSPTISVTPNKTTTYSAICVAKNDPKSTCSSSAATVTIGVKNPIGGSISSPTPNISIGITSVSPVSQCLPQTNTDFKDSFTWDVSTPNNCDKIIGGGTPSNSAYSCTLDGKSASPKTVSETLSQNKTYNIACTRDTYNCSLSQSFTSGSTKQNEDACNAKASSLSASYKDNFASGPSCSEGSCVRDLPHIDANCNERYCGTKSTVYDTCKKNCVIDPVTKLETCETYDCNPHEVCNYDGACYSWNCQDYKYNLSATSKTVNTFNTSNSIKFRVIPKPTINPLSPKDNFGNSKTKILLNQAINMFWSAASKIVSNIDLSYFSSGTSILCSRTSDKSDANWYSNGYIKEKSGQPLLSPKFTTLYNLFCRDRDNLDSQCYKEGDSQTKTIEVYQSTLEETKNQ